MDFMSKSSKIWEISKTVPVHYGNLIGFSIRDVPNRTGLAEPDRFETETEPNRLYREWNRIEPLAGQDLPEQF